MLYKTDFTSTSINDLIYSIFQGLRLTQEELAKYVARIHELIKGSDPEDHERLNILLARTLSECLVRNHAWKLTHAQDILKNYPDNQQIKSYVNKIDYMVKKESQRFIPTIDEDGLYTTPRKYKPISVYAEEIEKINPDTLSDTHYGLFETQAFIAADRFDECEVNKCIDVLLKFPQDEQDSDFQNNQLQIITRCAHALARTGDLVKADAVLARLPEVKNLWPQEDWPEYWQKRIGVIHTEQEAIKSGFRENISEDLEFSDIEPSPTPTQISALEKRIGYKLPQQYIDFLLKHNGGEPNFKAYPMKRDEYQWRLKSNMGWVSKLIPFSGLYSKYLSHIDESYTMMPIYGDDYDHLCLAIDPDLPDYGSVYFWMHGQTQDQSAFRRIALSFNHFLSMLEQDK